MARNPASAKEHVRTGTYGTKTIGKTALTMALEKKLSGKIVRAIAEADKDQLTTPDGYGLHHLHYALMNKAADDIILVLLDIAPETATVATPDGKTPRTLALEAGYNPKGLVVKRLTTVNSSSSGSGGAAAAAAANAAAAALLANINAEEKATAAKRAAAAAKKATKKAATPSTTVAAPAPPTVAAPAPGINLTGVELNYGVLPNNPESNHNKFLREANLVGKLNGGKRRSRQRKSRRLNRKSTRRRA